MFFFICKLHDMLLSLHNRSSQVKLLKTDEADEAFNVMKIRRISSQTFSSRNITQIWGYYVCLPGNFFLNIS